MNRLKMAKKELLQVKKLIDTQRWNINNYGNANYYTIYTKNGTAFEINELTTIFPDFNINEVIYVRKCLKNRNNLTFWDTDNGEFKALDNYKYFEDVETKYNINITIYPLEVPEGLKERYDYIYERRTNPTLIELKSDIYSFYNDICNELKKEYNIKNAYVTFKSRFVSMSGYITVVFKNNNKTIIRLSDSEPINTLHNENINITGKTYYDLLNDITDIIINYERS